MQDGTQGLLVDFVEYIKVIFYPVLVRFFLGFFLIFQTKFVIGKLDAY